MTSIRAHAHAKISLPEGWNRENTSVVFSVTVTREDHNIELPQSEISVETDDVEEYED